MTKRLAYTFRCPEPVQIMLEKIMEERNLDRTSVIKLALYQFCKTMERSDVREKDLYQLIQMLEESTPTTFMSFADFIDE